MRNDLVLFILSVIHGGYNMNVRCKQKFMFCKDRGIDFSVWLCVQYFLGISTLPPGITGIPTLQPAGRKNIALQHFNRHQKLNFLGVTKNIF